MEEDDGVEVDEERADDGREVGREGEGEVDEVEGRWEEKEECRVTEATSVCSGKGRGLLPPAVVSGSAAVNGAEVESIANRDGWRWTRRGRGERRGQVKRQIVRTATC